MYRNGKLAIIALFVLVIGICVLSLFANLPTASAGLYSGMELVYDSFYEAIYRCPVTDVLFYCNHKGLTYMPDPELPGLPLTQARYIELLNRQ